MDMNAYMADASKMTKSDPNWRNHPEINPKDPESRRRMAESPIFKLIEEQFPLERGYKVMFPNKMQRVMQGLKARWDKNKVLGKLPNPFPSLYQEGVFNVSPMFNVSHQGANRTVMTKINGEPIDIFLSDTYIPNQDGYLPAEHVLGWKEYFINKRNAYIKEHGFGLPPREKDIADIKYYRPYSKDNPVIAQDDTVQYAPTKFGAVISISKFVYLFLVLSISIFFTLLLIINFIILLLSI